MTTAKQVKANQANSKKSTGATSDEGKAVIAGNALKHGLFAQRLILSDENMDEYAQLIHGLVISLSPVGTLEQLLVEKIAVATWKQLRLTRAESATIELNRRMDIAKNRQAVSNAIGRNWDEPELILADFEQETDEDRERVAYRHAWLIEFKALDNDILYKCDLVKLKADAALIYQSLVDEAEAEEIELTTYMNEYLVKDNEGIHEWACESADWHEKELARQARKVLVQAIGQQLKNKLTAPIGNELLARYQAGIDNEMYKAIEALRKQQEWRSKGMVTLEAEVA